MMVNLLNHSAYSDKLAIVTLWPPPEALIVVGYICSQVGRQILYLSSQHKMVKVARKVPRDETTSHIVTIQFAYFMVM